MLIVSWNVAGLGPALQRINTDYGTAHSAMLLDACPKIPPQIPINPAENAIPLSDVGKELRASDKSNTPKTNFTKKNKSRTLTFENYLLLHGDVDILCLQEHKIPFSQLSSRFEPHSCSSISGYESFWSCCTDEKSRGFNGVVTYAKVGMVHSADSAPLNDPSLDNQGRCVMTDHGPWVLFNAYVPAGSDASSLPRKMKFLNALRNAMKRQREAGKHVMLVGDLNLKHCVQDLYWRFRVLNVDQILNQLKKKRNGEPTSFCNRSKNVNKSSDVSRWKVDLENHWERISSALQTIEAVPQQTKNPSTGETFSKFIARIKIGNNKFVKLGHYEETAEDAISVYKFDERTYIDPDQDVPIVYRKQNLICVSTLAELMLKIANVRWNETTLRLIADKEAGTNPDSPAFLWMKKLLTEDEMVDAFRYFYPAAEARFTCWNQSMNQRYVNAGGRIDFTLVDKALMKFVKKGDGKCLRCGPTSHNNPLGERAALAAATADGMFEPGSFAGGGIATPTQRALDTQFGPPHTGMIYTPPSYSDHIAVSLFLNDNIKQFMGKLLLDENDTSTRKSQPHKKQRSIASFFCAPPSSRVASSDSGSAPLEGGKRKVWQSGVRKSETKMIGSSDTSKKSRKAHLSASKENKKLKNSILNHFERR